MSAVDYNALDYFCSNISPVYSGVQWTYNRVIGKVADIPRASAFSFRFADFPTTEEESVNNWGVARDLIWLGPIPPTNLVWEVAYPNAPCQQVPQSGVQQLCL